MPTTTNIPGRPPYQPDIPGPEQAPPRQGRKWIRESNTVDESGVIFEQYVTVSRYQYWQQIHFHDLECGVNGLEGKYQLGGPVPVAALGAELAAFIKPRRPAHETFALLELYQGPIAPIRYAVDLASPNGRSA